MAIEAYRPQIEYSLSPVLDIAHSRVLHAIFDAVSARLFYHSRPNLSRMPGTRYRACTTAASKFSRFG
jgi:hypothetical protein